MFCPHVSQPKNRIIIRINITLAISPKATFLSCLSSFVVWVSHLCSFHMQPSRGSFWVFLLVHFCLPYFVDNIYNISTFVIKGEIHALLTIWRNYGNTGLPFPLSIWSGLVFMSTYNVADKDSNMINSHTCSHHFSIGFYKLLKEE